jgi:hypothetical protein
MVLESQASFLSDFDTYYAETPVQGKWAVDTVLSKGIPNPEPMWTANC